MEGCKECKQPTNQFDIIGKTYYKLDCDNTIVCYRHWHQMGRPKFNQKGEYSEIFSKGIYIKKYERK